MRRVAPLALFATHAALLSACASASSSSSASAGAGVNAASGPQPIGAPCDPALAVPCVPTADPCLGVSCAPVTRVCADYLTDAGPPCRSGAAPCTTSADCDLGLTCGFPVSGGCAAHGVCLNPPLLCENDAASCVTGGAACGCDGLPVALVTGAFASAPVSGVGSCADGGPLSDASTGLDGAADTADAAAGP